MECLVCNSRSALECCNVCHMLLCEECGARCAKCGKRICPEHVYTTSKGKLLCTPCQDRRKARHDAKHGAVQEAEALEVVPTGSSGSGTFSSEEAGLGDAEVAILVASVRKPPPPWKLSLYTAAAGAVLVAVVLIVPGLRRMALPWGGTLPTPYLFLLAPAMALFWAGAGYFGRGHTEERRRCWYGAALAIATIALALFAVYTDPARLAEQDGYRLQEERSNMTPGELKAWREQKLQKYRK